MFIVITDFANVRRFKDSLAAWEYAQLMMRKGHSVFLINRKTAGSIDYL